jgi:acetyl-CoA carboxylase carboxyl transferase subunit alpha
MGITAERLLELKLIDRIVEEPLGGAHRDHQAAADALRDALVEDLGQLSSMLFDDLVEKRSERLRSFGEFREA